MMNSQAIYFMFLMEDWRNRFITKSKVVTGIPWDGSKSHHKRNVSREVMHEILRWHNFDLAEILIMCLNPEMAHLFSPFDQNSTHSKPRMDFLRILSNLRVLCMHIVCKNEPFRSFHTWSRFLANFKLSHVNISCIWYESYDITSRETFLLLWLFEQQQPGPDFSKKWFPFDLWSDQYHEVGLGSVPK